MLLRREFSEVLIEAKRRKVFLFFDIFRQSMIGDSGWRCEF